MLSIPSPEPLAKLKPLRIFSPSPEKVTPPRPAR
jgi:hypothetical protein